MNIATLTSQKMYDMLKATDRKVKEYATEPYGQRKLTEAEQMMAYRSLTPEKMYETIQGMDYKQFQKFNNWLYKMEQKEANNGR